MAPEETNQYATEQQPRCEIHKTILAGECWRLGEVRLDGSLLCKHHAELLGLEDRSDTLLGTVFEMDKWLDNPHNRTDEARWRRVLHERDEVVKHLRLTRTQIEGIRSESLEK